MRFITVNSAALNYYLHLKKCLGLQLMIAVESLQSFVADFAEAYLQKIVLCLDQSYRNARFACLESFLVVLELSAQPVRIDRN